MEPWFMPYADDVNKMGHQQFRAKLYGTSGITEQTYDEAKGTAQRTGVSTKQITSLQEAKDFFQIDEEEWFIERWVCNAWDVTMKTDDGPTKATNYQVKVWLVRKKNPLKEIQYAELQKRVQPPAIVTPKGDFEMWVIIGCIHRPFHDKVVWGKLMTFLSEYKTKITGLVINGDYLDLKTLSNYEQGEVPIEGLTLRSEYEDGYIGIQEIKQALGREYKRIEKHYLYGNHEHRYFKILKKPDYYKLGLTSPAEALRLDEEGYSIQYNYPDGVVQIGDIDVCHGLYFSANAAQTHLSKVPNRSCVFNHTHRFGYASNGEQEAHNIGWLGDPDSIGFRYADRFMKSQWQQGFGVIYVDDYSLIRPVKIHNKSILFDGRKF